MVLMVTWSKFIKQIAKIVTYSVWQHSDHWGPSLEVIIMQKPREKRQHKCLQNIWTAKTEKLTCSLDVFIKNLEKSISNLEMDF